MQACCRPAGRGSQEARHSTLVLNSCCVLQVLHDLNQLVDKESMRLALQFCHAADNPYFRLCYNSLGRVRHREPPALPGGASPLESAAGCGQHFSV